MMAEESETLTDAEIAAAEEVNRKGRARLAASRAKEVPHILKLRPPVTLYRMAGVGRAKKDREWVASLDALPTIESIQQQYGGGRYVIIDPSGQRYQVTLADVARAAVQDPPPAQRNEHQRRAAEPPSAAARPEPLATYDPRREGGAYDPHTGQPLHRAPAYDPHTGQPLHRAAAYDPHTGQPLHRAPTWREPGAPEGVIGAQILAELRSRRETPMPPASDFGSQIVDMMRAMDGFEKLRAKFSGPPAVEEDEAEAGLMGMLAQVLPMLMPAVGAAMAPPVARVAAAAPVAAPQTDRQAAVNPPSELEQWAAEPLTPGELADLQRTMAVVGRWAPSITLEFLGSAGAEAGLTERQAVFLFQRIFVEFLPAGAAGGVAEESSEEEWSEEDEWSDEDPMDTHPKPSAGGLPVAPDGLRAPTTPALSMSQGPRSPGPELTPASPPTESGPSESLPE